MPQLRHLLSIVAILLLLAGMVPSQAEAQNVCNQCENITYVIFIPGGHPLIFSINRCKPTPGNNMGLTSCTEVNGVCQLGGFVCVTSIV